MISYQRAANVIELKKLGNKTEQKTHPNEYLFGISAEGPSLTRR